MARIDYREIAPIIVLGRVTGNQAVGSPSQAIRDQSVKLQRRRITVERELQVRGSKTEAIAESFHFEYFAAVDSRTPLAYARSLFQADVGHRYLFFLYRDESGLRSIGDVGDYSVRVYAGATRDVTPREKGDSEGLAHILLRVHDGANPSEFSAHLRESYSVAAQYTSRLVLRRLLRELLAHSEGGIRREACLLLSDRFRGQEGCIRTEFIAAHKGDQDVSYYHELLRKAAASDERLANALTDPARLEFFADLSGRLTRALEELVLLLDHPNSKIRVMACDAVQRYFPLSDWARSCNSVLRRVP